MILADFVYGIIGLLSLVGLIGGSEKVVHHCVVIMKEKGVSGGLLGLSVISIGTSLPEIITHIIASIDILTGQLRTQVASATVLGTSIGSDIVQQTVLIGFVALLGVLTVPRRFVKRDMSMLIGATAIVWLLGRDGHLTRFEGAALMAIYGIYLTTLYLQGSDQAHNNGAVGENHRTANGLSPRAHWVWIVGGLLVVVTCGHFALASVDHFVERFGLGGSLLGVAVIGVSTALPELSTAVSSIRRNQSGLSVGTLIGSNITNPLLGIGAGAALSTYVVPRVLLVYDLPVKVGIAIMVLLFLLRDRQLRRYQAIILITSYAAYLAVRFILFPQDVYSSTVG